MKLRCHNLLGPQLLRKQFSSSGQFLHSKSVRLTYFMPTDVGLPPGSWQFDRFLTGGNGDLWYSTWEESGYLVADKPTWSLTGQNLVLAGQKFEFDIYQDHHSLVNSPDHPPPFWCFIWAKHVIIISPLSYRLSHYHTICSILSPCFLIIDPLKEKTPPPWSSRKCLHAVFFLWTGSFPCPIVGAGGAQFDFRDVSHLQPLAATCPVSHLQPLGRHLLQWLPSGCKWLTGQVAASGCQVASSGCKWLQVADGASGCKWLTGQVAASGLPSGCKWLQVAAKWLQVAASGWRGKWLQVAAKWLQVAAKCYLEKKVILEILLFFKIAASGCQVAAKWLAGQVAAKWLTGQVRAGTI